MIFLLRTYYELLLNNHLVILLCNYNKELYCFEILYIVHLLKINSIEV